MEGWICFVLGRSKWCSNEHANRTGCFSYRTRYSSETTRYYRDFKNSILKKTWTFSKSMNIFLEILKILVNTNKQWKKSTIFLKKNFLKVLTFLGINKFWIHPHVSNFLSIYWIIELFFKNRNILWNFNQIWKLWTVFEFFNNFYAFLETRTYFKIPKHFMNLSNFFERNNIFGNSIQNLKLWTWKIQIFLKFPHYFYNSIFWKRSEHYFSKFWKVL